MRNAKFDYRRIKEREIEWQKSFRNYENQGNDGSICAQIPVTWVKILPPAARSEEQKEQARERMRNYHAEHDRVTHENE